MSRYPPQLTAGRNFCLIMSLNSTLCYTVVEKITTMEDVETWLEENEGDPGYQMLLAEEIADAVRAADKRTMTRRAVEERSRV
ncbi:hypothetical protein Hamer_G002807 [Homarus americanus]|uniref:Uncharacterized protein n=1 Tax=Homarus americanus TaxID=6706 RepID=A0A8J5MU13_HOMAM|nr:hypothetical protein Hamer_G002807 [Homarus americanus]